MSSPTDTALNAGNFSDRVNEVGETEEQNAQPPAKKRKLMKKKVTTAEKVMTSVIKFISLDLANVTATIVGIIQNVGVITFHETPPSSFTSSKCIFRTTLA